MEIGRKILELREAAGLSQEDLARLAGLKAPTISRWETQRIGKIDARALVRIAYALGVPVSAFYQDGDLPKPDVDKMRAEVLELHREHEEYRKRMDQRFAVLLQLVGIHSLYTLSSQVA